MLANETAVAALGRLEKAAVAKPSDGRRGGALLRHIRREKLRQPRVVCDHGARLLKHKRGVGADELWTVYEQVAMAACDLPNVPLATECITQLRKRFPESNRVTRLVGLLQEAGRKPDDAKETYGILLEENPSNVLASKRELAISKAQDTPAVYAKKLGSFLEQCHADTEAWQELAGVHMECGKFGCAAFCFEELVLAAPLNHLHHCRLAECLYSTGKAADALTARNYFAQSLDLKRELNPRAAHGLAACCFAIACGKDYKPGAGDALVNAALHAAAAKSLRGMYAARTDAAMLKMVNALLATHEEAVGFAGV